MLVSVVFLYVTSVVVIVTLCMCASYICNAHYNGSGKFVRSVSFGEFDPEKGIKETKIVHGKTFPFD